VTGKGRSGTGEHPLTPSAQPQPLPTHPARTHPIAGLGFPPLGGPLRAASAPLDFQGSPPPARPRSGPVSHPSQPATRPSVHALVHLLARPAPGKPPEPARGPRRTTDHTAPSPPAHTSPVRRAMIPRCSVSIGTLIAAAGMGKPGWTMAGHVVQRLGSGPANPLTAPRRAQPAPRSCQAADAPPSTLLSGRTLCLVSRAVHNRSDLSSPRRPCPLPTPGGTIRASRSLDSVNARSPPRSASRPRSPTCP